MCYEETEFVNLLFVLWHLLWGHTALSLCSCRRCAQCSHKARGCALEMAVSPLRNALFLVYLLLSLSLTLCLSCSTSPSASITLHSSPLNHNNQCNFLFPPIKYERGLLFVYSIIALLTLLDVTIATNWTPSFTVHIYSWCRHTDLSLSLLLEHITSWRIEEIICWHYKRHHWLLWTICFNCMWVTFHTSTHLFSPLAPHLPWCTCYRSNESCHILSLSVAMLTLATVTLSPALGEHHHHSIWWLSPVLHFRCIEWSHCLHCCLWWPGHLHPVK